jgi:alpha-L-fucosidase
MQINAHHAQHSTLTTFPFNLNSLITMIRNFIFLTFFVASQYAYSQASNQHERMGWWREARFGMFIHWGLYAIPAGEWKGKTYPQIGEWIMLNAKIPHPEYQQLAKQFNPQKFNAREVVALARNAGMKYLAITAKHHDGFAMFKSNASAYNIVDGTPYGKDVVKMLAEECYRQGLKFCFYYSHARDWNERDGLGNNWDFPADRNFQKYLDEKVKPQLTELLTNYGPISLIWFDTPMTISREQAQEIKDLVRKLQPQCIISGRLGGDVETDYKSTSDNLIPPENIPGDWEVPATLNNTWGYKKSDNDWKSSTTIVKSLFDIAAKGGNYLLNIGPTAEGEIPPASVEVLENVGKWMKVNGVAIYGTNPNPLGKALSWGNITHKGNRLYLGIFGTVPDQRAISFGGLQNKVTRVYFLADGKKSPLQFVQKKEKDQNTITISLPPDRHSPECTIVVCEFKGDLKISTTEKPAAKKNFEKYFGY